ncbi:MAG: zinc-dependent alcohol dehydrogenase family protein [Dehalococcoidales bacterium]|nr:zinc-dependent alcohol dehydrogenase family protein [Dehalococcoidales bacterium]
MKALVLSQTGPVENQPLRLVDLPVPEPKAGEILVEVAACGVCHTELDEIEGRLTPQLPIILGHEIIGRVVKTGKGAGRYKTGDRIGIAWINSACGKCEFCNSGRENLCPEFRGTGCEANGGYAEYTTVDERFTFPIPERFTDTQAAPLLCAGAIGYRDLQLAGMNPGQTLGLFGFGASAHIVLQMAKYFGHEIYVFTRGEEHQNLANDLGASWTGTSQEKPPHPVDCAIDFTPVGETIPDALRVLKKGGRLVVAVIRKRTPVPAMDYAGLLWDEKEVKSVANITRRDAEEFLPLAAKIPIVPEVQEFPLENANEALILLKQGKIRGAAVLKINRGGRQ